ncbi:hypothetical protein MRAB57_5532 [Mycobacterium rhizamassiliense]|jgi:hypothetical protein|uniref:Uncharacterized protein n=1 Tax=Mycobacterium rhizamassiliense TaxID=1841860 RepID=A0A2U3P1P9_9MYCO|nr:hypothetical protein [Mycobacterium rhizamassiliense]SPM37683.1 hypothetical protein MRAB57_5532 [Mycobacterium rhizamassiliense]
MTWTAQLTYTAAALTPDETAALSRGLGPADVSYDARSGRLQITLEVEADSLEAATDTGLRAADTTGLLLTPIRLLVQSTADFAAHPEALNLDLIGITEIAGELGVSRQRAGKLADDPDFPAPVVHCAAGRFYTRASVQAFHDRWAVARNPRGGRRRRLPEPSAT